MKRRAKAVRPRLGVESLETRALLSTAGEGMWPLPNPGSSNSVLVRFREDAPASARESALAALGASSTSLDPDGPELIRLGRGVAADSAIQFLESDPSVLYAEANATIHASSVTPNDSEFGTLWGLNNPNNVDIDAPEAWDITTGAPSTIVAVIDSGIDLTNPDFVGKIWRNPDDAGQDYPNAINGWNFVGRNNNVQDDDDEGHGTHISAIIAAAGHNAYGITGVDWNAQIMPLKFLDSEGNGSTSDAVSAIYFAVRHGARVINASWGGVDNDEALRDAIRFANNRNVLFVTAAGNESSNNDFVANYPSSFRLPNELSVAAVDRNGQLASFSNYGARTVDVAAPGVGILSEVPAAVSPDRLGSLSGTSMATAYVSGVAALLVGREPSLTAAQIAGRIRNTAKSLPSLQGKTISGGMVDAFAALTGGSSGTVAGGSPAAGLPILIPGTASVPDLQSFFVATDEFLASNGGTPEGFVTGLYQIALGRVPDPVGLQQWTGVYNTGLATRYQIAQAILTSPEGRATEVARWFQDDLNRDAPLEALKADPGIMAWANLLLAGVGDETVEAAIMTSPEYIAGHGGTPSSVVQGFYEDLYGRVPSPIEQAAWAGNFYAGYTPFVVLRFFQSTPEAGATKVARWFVDILGRPYPLAFLKADPGIATYAATLNHL